MDYRIILPVIVVAIVAVFFLTNTSESILGLAVTGYTVPNWDEVRERDIVKNSIPIVKLEETLGGCKVTAEKFQQIIDHAYFIRSADLVNQLNFDSENNTLIIPCDELKGEKSKLNVWYAKEEAPKHGEKYEYFVTPWE